MQRFGWAAKQQVHAHAYEATDRHAGIARSVCGDCGHVRIRPTDEPMYLIGSSATDSRAARIRSLLDVSWLAHDLSETVGGLA